jgi:hypothetical protein
MTGSEVSKKLYDGLGGGGRETLAVLFFSKAAHGTGN